MANITMAAAMSSDSTPHWDMPAIWDSSHLLNLAERDVLKSKESIWAQETIQSVTAITQHFTWGQGYEQLQDCTDRGKAAAPRLWSETRFAAHAGKVLKGFWRNIDAMVKSLEKRSCKARGAHAADLLRDLRVLKDEHFLRYVAALRDVYDVIAQGSVALQNTQLLPWEVTAAYDAAMEKLERMMNPLNVLAGTNPQREQTLVGRHVALCNLAELWPTFGQHGHRDVKQMREVATFCGNLLVSMKARRQGKDAHGNKRGTANAALLDNIRHVKTVGCLLDVAASSLPERVQVSQVRLACRELSAAKLVPPAAVPPEWSIIEGVKFLTSQKPSSNEALMQALWLTARENAALRPFLHLVIRCWLLCPAESVVESMGSVLKDVFGSKRQLNHDNAAKELLIRWNGPEVGRVDSLISDVQRSRGFDFTRQGQRVKSIAGLVVTKQVNKGYTSDLFG